MDTYLLLGTNNTSRSCTEYLEASASSKNNTRSTEEDCPILTVAGCCSHLKHSENREFET